MTRFGRTMLAYARPYRAGTLLVFLTQPPSELLNTAPQLRTDFARAVDARPREPAALR